MRKIQQYILKEKKIFVGLEDYKKTWKLCVRCDRDVVNDARMPAKYDNLRNYFHNNFPDCTVHVIYEAGFRGFGLHDKIENDGWNCVVTPPHTVTEEKCQRLKNDRIDCRRLAKNLENRDYRSCYVPDQELREDRQISRTYAQVQKDIVKVSNRLRKMLEFHDIDKYFPPGSWTKKMYNEFRPKLEKIEMSPSLKFSFDITLRELEHLKALKKELWNALRDLAKSERYKEDVDILKSAPGIGIFTAIRLVLELGDVTRFKNKEKFSSFLGLIPGEYSSGETERKGHITKQGNRSIRAWLIESSWVAIRYDPIILKKYRSIYKRSGSKKKAIVAVARKLAIRLRPILISREMYVFGAAE